MDIVYVSLDALNELLAKFAALAPDHEKLIKVVEPQLGSQRQITRKCAISCLGLDSFVVVWLTLAGNLASAITDKLFSSLVANLVKHVEGSKKTEEARTYIQAIGAISRSAGGRLGRFLEQIIPLISKVGGLTLLTLLVRRREGRRPEGGVLFMLRVARPQVPRTDLTVHRSDHRFGPQVRQAGELGRGGR